MPRREPEAPPFGAVPGRCRCGHLALHHMVVRPLDVGGSYRLMAVGPCALCGIGFCAAFSPGPLPAGQP